MAKVNQCKQCLSDLTKGSFSGLRYFCSEECKEVYRRAYLTEKKRENRAKRTVDNEKTYQGMGFPNVNKSNPTAEPVYKGEIWGSRTFHRRLLLPESGRRVDVQFTPMADSAFTWIKYTIMYLRKECYIYCYQVPKLIAEKWIKEGMVY